MIMLLLNSHKLVTRIDAFGLRSIQIQLNPELPIFTLISTERIPCHYSPISFPIDRLNKSYDQGHNVLRAVAQLVQR